MLSGSCIQISYRGVSYRLTALFQGVIAIIVAEVLPHIRLNDFKKRDKNPIKFSCEEKNYLKVDNFDLIHTVLLHTCIIL